MSAPAQPPAQSRTAIDGIAGGVLIGLGALVGIAGLARGFGVGGSALSFDETTLLYLAVAGALVLLPRVKTFAFRDFRLELQQAKEKADHAQAEAIKAREMAGQAGAQARQAQEEADRAAANATTAQTAATGAQEVALTAAQPVVLSHRRPSSGSRSRKIGEAQGGLASSEPDSSIKKDKRSLLEVAAETKRPGTAENDPWKNAFGGKSEANGRKLTATVRPIQHHSDYYVVHLLVERTGRRPLAGDVMFFLHHDFPQQRVLVPVDKNGRAEMRFFGWGAFTVGALCDDGETELELDLAELPDVPHEFALA